MPSPTLPSALGEEIAEDGETALIDMNGEETADLHANSLLISSFAFRSGESLKELVIGEWYIPLTLGET